MTQIGCSVCLKHLYLKMWIKILLVLTLVGCSAAAVVDKGRSKEAPGVPVPAIQIDDRKINKLIADANTIYCNAKVCAIAICMQSPYTPRQIFKRHWISLDLIVVVTTVYCSEASLSTSEIF